MSKQQQGGFIRFDRLDPVVNDLITDAAASPAGRPKTAAQRKKAAKDRQRNRRMIDMPPALERQIENLAAETGVPFSSLVVYVLASRLPAVSIEELISARVPSRSMRFEFVLPYRGAKK